jgi:TPR repeat protein
MYENGNVVPRNIAMAIEMFRKAAAQGYQSAKKELQCLGYEQ